MENKRQNQNLKHKKLFVESIFLFGIIILSSFISANEDDLRNDIINVSEEQLCERQLNRTVELYNNLLVDFRDGINCGGAAISLKYMNELLSEERNECREEIGELRVYNDELATYKIGFYLLFFILVIIMVIKLYRIMRKK